VSKKRMLRRILGPKCEEETGGWKKNYIMSFTICTLHLLFLMCVCGTLRKIRNA
jgi:hypothetical protein